MKNAIGAVLSWWSETFTRQKLGGKVVFGCGTLFILCLVFGAISNAFSPKSQAQPTLDVGAIYTSAAMTVIAQQPTRPLVPTSTPSPTDTLAPTTIPTSTLLPAQETATDIALYKPISAQELVTYPDNHIGEFVFIQGRIFNIIGNTDLQMYVGSGYDAVYVQMQDPFRGIYKDDYITVYGIVAGTNCGTNAFGGQICQALITAATFIQK